MAAIRDYYQIVGVNNRCVEIKRAVKDSGAALEIQDCDAGRPSGLWGLIEAPR